jgi:hypothetical protein
MTASKKLTSMLVWGGQSAERQARRVCGIAARDVAQHIAGKHVAAVAQSSEATYRKYEVIETRYFRWYAAIEIVGEHGRGARVCRSCDTDGKAESDAENQRAKE